jgi:hypothetical protein
MPLPTHLQPHPFSRLLLATEHTEFDQGAERIALAMMRRAVLPSRAWAVEGSWLLRPTTSRSAPSAWARVMICSSGVRAPCRSSAWLGFRPAWLAAWQAWSSTA